MKCDRDNLLFKKIFDRHYFSNHHIEAQKVETRLEKFFSGYEAVTFSSMPGLICAIIDEIINKDLQLSFMNSSRKYNLVNEFVRATRDKNNILVKLEDLHLQEKVNNTLGASRRFGKVVLHKGNNLLGILLDFGKLDAIIASAPVFISQNKDYCEKIRWARSSYGRKRNDKKINIASNGRFSEFQAEVINNKLNNLDG